MVRYVERSACSPFALSPPRRGGSQGEFKSGSGFTKRAATFRTTAMMRTNIALTMPSLEGFMGDLRAMESETCGHEPFQPTAYTATRWR